MSYLDSPRVHFHGWFQADVSTINNDVRFFQNASFIPEYQQLNQNGSWNPEGTGIFRLLDCVVTGVVAENQLTPGAGITVQNAADRAPGKLVDLDPQQQMVSEIWGMQVRLVSPSGKTLMQGEFKPAAFINLWLRQLTGVLNDQQLAASYQSVLERVEWFDLSEYPALRTLSSTTQDDQLSIAFDVYGYARDATIPRYTMGHVNGTIGPYFHGEPKHFTRGRQFIYTGNFPAPAGNFGNLQAKVAPKNTSITADFGNSFQVETADSGLKDIGQVFLAVLKADPSTVLNTVSDADIVIIGEIPYRSDNWYAQTAGLQTFDLTSNSDAQNLISNHPLVVLTPIAAGGGYNVLIEESINGLYVRSDQYVYRVDPGDSRSIEFYADQFGAPLPNAVIELSDTQGFMGGSGGGKRISPTPRPTAAVPDISTPSDVIRYKQSVTADKNGYATVDFSTSADGPGTPRGYISGQLYGLGYQLSTQPAGYVSNPMNYVSILAYSKKDPREKPTWYRDIQPLFTQYGNLYPIMGRFVVNLGDYASVVNHLKILTLAFSLPIEDPNHMPVSRDLGKGDRATILQWLSTRGADGLPLLGTPDQSPAVKMPEAVDQVATQSAVDLLPSQSAGKTAFILQLQQRLQGGPQKGGKK